MKAIEYPKVQETVYAETLDNGLEVFILPKEGFSKTFATFSTKYGSIDNWFAAGEEEPTRVPDGIAHFLEHKMFEEPEGDIFAQFASNGASANAYTSFDRTVYLFSATGRIRENVTTLLDFVQNPYFTDQNVEKEKGIIGQEIKMYADQPDWRAYFGLIEALYEKHPVHIDIAGTVESISGITKETLYHCYHTFYHPQNMSLFIVGGVNPKEIMDLIKENQAAKTFRPQGDIRRLFEPEPSHVREKEKIIRLPVSLPKCLFGLKEERVDLAGEALLRQELATKLLFDMLFSPSSALYQELYDEQLITSGFGAEYNTGAQYAFSVFGGDTRDPEALVARVRDAVDGKKETGLSEALFERTRRKKIGSFFRMLNSLEAIAGEFTKHRFRGVDLFQVLDIYGQITLDEVNERLRDHFNWERMSISIVRSE